MHYGFGDAATDAMTAAASAAAANAATDAANLDAARLAYAARVAAADRAALYLGILGAIAGLFVGGLFGSRFSDVAKYGGAATGTLAFGFGTYYASRQLLTPKFIAPLTTDQQILLKDLVF